MMSSDEFCINDYDCIGFDMDHTIVQYDLPQLYRLLYKCVVDFLVTEKKYCGSTFNLNNFQKFEDFSLRGIIFDIKKGNFVKLDTKGYVLRCTHGLKECSPEETISYYGEERIWPLFPILKEKIYHSNGYWIMENFFLLPLSSIIGQMVEEADKSNGGKPLEDYKLIHKHVLEAASNAYAQPHSFDNDVGKFFPSLKKETGKYIKKIPESVVTWIRYLRKKGKTVVLITDSFCRLAELLMNFALGPDWKNEFDFIIARANKPNFFKPEFENRNFVNVDASLSETTEVNVTLKPHTLYTLGNARKFEETIKSYTGKESIKVVYFGDSMKSDVYPPKNFVSWDTVAVLEELEAEEVHFHKNNKAIYHQAKRPKLIPLLKEEKLLIASSQWGSFFTHPKNNQNGNSNSDGRHEINTFWGDVIKTYSCLAIPLLDYLTETSIEERFPRFTDNQFGFFPSAPRSVINHHCQEE